MKKLTLKNTFLTALTPLSYQAQKDLLMGIFARLRAHLMRVLPNPKTHPAYPAIPRAPLVNYMTFPRGTGTRVETLSRIRGTS